MIYFFAGEKFEVLPKNWRGVIGCLSDKRKINGGYSKNYSSLTWQFRGYSKYKSDAFSPEEKAKIRETVFPEDCGKARQIGRDLVNGRNG